MWGTKSQDSVHRPQLLKRKDSRSRFVPRSFCLPAYRLTAGPNRLTMNEWIKIYIYKAHKNTSTQNLACAQRHCGWRAPSPKVQALFYDILPSTIAVFSYAIGSRKLSANEQFFCWCLNSSKFFTNNSNDNRRLFYFAMLLTPAEIKPKSFESTRNLFSFFFYPRWMRLMFTCVLGR